MNNSKEKSAASAATSGPDERGYIGWGAVAGALVGAVVGAFAGHWTTYAFFIGLFGLLVGALIDRARR